MKPTASLCFGQMEYDLERIYIELRRRKLGVNRFRKRTGEGISQTFGLVGRRCLPVDYSRLCWTRPYLYKLLLEFGKKYVDIPWNAITVNDNYKAGPHYDKNNVGESYLIAFGDYEGGELKIHEGELEGYWDVKEKPLVADFSKMLHSVEPWHGERFSLVFYSVSLEHKGCTLEIPPPSVRLVDGKFRFFRGEEMIEKGLPHPLRGKKKAPLQRPKPEVHLPNLQPSQE